MMPLMAMQAPQLDSGGGQRSIYSSLKENIGVSKAFYLSLSLSAQSHLELLFNPCSLSLDGQLKYHI